MSQDQFLVRKVMANDAAEIAEIYNEGLDERLATFNTEHITVGHVRLKIGGGEKHPTLVAADLDRVVGFASILAYSSRTCYLGVGEVSIYIRKGHRGQGIGKALLQALINAAEARGYWKLTTRIFVSNAASRALFGKLGFREVGVLEKHSRLDGKWLDVVEVERLITANLT